MLMYYHVHKTETNVQLESVAVLLVCFPWPFSSIFHFKLKKPEACSINISILLRKQACCPPHTHSNTIRHRPLRSRPPWRRIQPEPFQSWPRHINLLMSWSNSLWRVCWPIGRGWRQRRMRRKNSFWGVSTPGSDSDQEGVEGDVGKYGADEGHAACGCWSCVEGLLAAQWRAWFS